MHTLKQTLLAFALVALAVPAYAAPTAQINIPSTDAKGLKELAISVTNYTRFSSKSNAGPNSYALGVETGLLPFENVKLEVGVDYVSTGSGSETDDHPFYFNAKLATAEELGAKWMPAFAVGIFNAGTYDRPATGVSTRQNISYLLAAKTLPVVGRLSVGGISARSGRCVPRQTRTTTAACSPPGTAPSQRFPTSSGWGSTT